EPVGLRAVRPRYTRGQPAEELPVPAYPPVLASAEGKVPTGIVVVDADLGGESGAGIAPLDEVVRKEGVLREPPSRRLLERIDIIDPLSGEAPLTVQVLVDI